ncbi:MAG: radical SAM protein [Verrucomicrobia bacterium]|nr:radical SAM protein [Verrucomicrobiota bacterium]
MTETLVINEIYLSLQGESTFAGLPCIFVRLTACDLRCSYCDTAYAFTEGKKMSSADVLAETRRLAAPFKTRMCHTMEVKACVEAPQAARGARALPLVELTGGEPLLQKASLSLMKSLCDEGFTVLLETSGAHDISPVDPRVHCIMDLKCPSSGEVSRNRWENLKHLKAKDEIKFVLGTAQDYQWAKEQLAQHRLASICPVLFSWVSPLTVEQRHSSLKHAPLGQTAISRKELAERIIADALPVRFQLQMHKVIWAVDSRGV